jgi:GTP cyclohydrolase II
MQAVDSNPERAAAAKRGGLNGDEAALSVDRAIGELRRGRAIVITGAGADLVFAAVEVMSSRLLQRLLDASPATRLLLTAERARAAGLTAHAAGPVAMRVGAGDSLDQLKALSGMAGPVPGPAAHCEDWRGDPAPVLAAFGLAKAARMVPAVLGFPAPEPADLSLHRVTLGAILEYASATSGGIQLISEARVPLAGSEASRVALFRDEYGGSEHVAVIVGEPDLAGSVPVRLHSACLTGDLLASLRCDCGEQLRSAIERIAELGGGVLLYLDQEGRSIGLANKLRAYQIQDTGVDTFDADHHLGFSEDERSYDVAVAMLQKIGVARVRLLTNNPQKIDALREHGIDVEARLPLVTKPNAHNRAYLQAKRERAGHLGD